MTTRRINRIFQADGRALIVALDHGLLDGPTPGLEKPGETIQKIVKGGADAVLTSYGISIRFAKELARVGLILRADGSGTRLSGYQSANSIFFDVEQALDTGADALAISAFPGGENEVESLEILAQTVGLAHAHGLPVMAEMVPGGFDSPPEKRTTDAIALAARVGAELGADFIKTPYAPDFEQVSKKTFIPVVILGGAKRGKEVEMLRDIKAAVDAGANGVAIGRNIFQAEDPTVMTQAISAILHKGASVEEALSILAK